MLDTLRAVVELESPSHDPGALGRLAEHMAREFARRGGHAQLHSCEKNGPHLQVDFAGGIGKPVLLLGHYDTVWGVGTLAKMPFRTQGRSAFGPVIFDMKAGIVMMLYAVETL